MTVGYDTEQMTPNEHGLALRVLELTTPPPAGVVRMADIDPIEVEWVWHPYIPRGKLTLLEGDPGQGKSWISLGIATALSLGHGLPGQEDPKLPSRVLVMTAEDGLDDTIRPRLDSMGADVTRVYACEGVDSFDEEGLDLLENRAAELRPDLMVVDPLVAYIGARVDIHRANETRAVLSRLASIADRTRSAVLAIRHLNKSSGGKAIYRGLGSIDFTAAVRSVLLVGQDPDDTTSGAVVHIKSNLAPRGDSLGYRLSPKDGFAWTGPSTVTADELLGTGEGPASVNEFLLGEPRPLGESTSECHSCRSPIAAVERPLFLRADSRSTIERIKQNHFARCRRGDGSYLTARWMRRAVADHGLRNASTAFMKVDVNLPDRPRLCELCGDCTSYRSRFLARRPWLAGMPR